MSKFCKVCNIHFNLFCCVIDNMMFVANLYRSIGITAHEDEYNIFNSPLISLRVSGSTKFGLGQCDYNSVYNDKLEIDMPEHSMLILTLAFRHHFRHGILRRGLINLEKESGPSISLIARDCDTSKFKKKTDKNKWLQRENKNKKQLHLYARHKRVWNSPNLSE